MGTSLLKLERALSCHLIYLWKLVARFGLFWGVFIKLLAKKRRDTEGYGVKILKMNENIDWPMELSRG
jgi:hypothetical protein